MTTESSLSAQPLLTVCVPTYNREDFLKVMLEALLPQVAELKGQVEVVVADNASPDNTEQVCNEAQGFCAFRYIRNSENLGPVQNIIEVARDHAEGQYVWMTGDHNLLAPGALQRVVDTICGNADRDLFYVNFRCATYPDQWPASALGGYDGSFAYLNSQDTQDRSVGAWHELIDPATAMCTQIYAHIVKREIWQSYWKNCQTIGSHETGRNTYPHTWMLADAVFDQPAIYIGQPAVTIFNGAQSWGDIPTKTRVFLKGLPELISLFARKGMSADCLSACRASSRESAERLLTHAFSQQDTVSIFTVLRHLWIAGWSGRSTWNTVRRTAFHARKSPLTRAIGFFSDMYRQCAVYCFHNCRPARWVRARHRSK